MSSSCLLSSFSSTAICSAIFWRFSPRLPHQLLMGTLRVANPTTLVRPLLVRSWYMPATPTASVGISSPRFTRVSRWLASPFLSSKRISVRCSTAVVWFTESCRGSGNSVVRVRSMSMSSPCLPIYCASTILHSEIPLLSFRRLTAISFCFNFTLSTSFLLATPAS